MLDDFAIKKVHSDMVNGLFKIYIMETKKVVIVGTKNFKKRGISFGRDNMFHIRQKIYRSV